jgi:hypothetical protein
MAVSINNEKGISWNTMNVFLPKYLDNSNMFITEEMQN